MKIKIILPLIFILILLFPGCKNEEKIVINTAKTFLDYLNAKQYDKARKISTPESKDMIDVLESFGSIDRTGEKPKPIEDLKCTISKDTAHCTYVQEFEEKSLTLVKIKNKWLVDMKKETPDWSLNSDSVSNRNSTYYNEYDTATYFDVRLLEAKDINGSAHLVFDISNRSEYNIQHLWMTLYFSDKNDKLLLKKDIMFNGVLKNSMYDNISNSEEIKDQGKIEIVADNIKVEDIDEIFIYPFRIQLEQSYYEINGNLGTLGDLYSFAKRNTLIKNSTLTNIKIIF